MYKHKWGDMSGLGEYTFSSWVEGDKVHTQMDFSPGRGFEGSIVRMVEDGKMIRFIGREDNDSQDGAIGS